MHTVILWIRLNRVLQQSKLEQGIRKTIRRISGLAGAPLIFRLLRLAGLRIELA
ncbi:hypothetical protein D3C75_1177380 [compost metagenome]